MRIETVWTSPSYPGEGHKQANGGNMIRYGTLKYRSHTRWIKGRTAQKRLSGFCDKYSWCLLIK
jgi:hypothetical protein